MAKQIYDREDEYLLALWDENVCPYCGKEIPEGTRVGSGRKRDGGFCSLDCYARYHELALKDRARRVNAKFQQGGA
jgi:hypothetical protein